MYIFSLNSYVRFNDYVSACVGSRLFKTNKCYSVVDDSDAIWFAVLDRKLHDIPFARKSVKCKTTTADDWNLGSCILVHLLFVGPFVIHDSSIPHDVSGVSC